MKFNEFNPQIDNWDSYIDRLKYCFEANGVVTDSAKRANFFTICGSHVFETVLALISPRKSGDVTFSDIENILTKHYSPKSNEISLSYKFYKCDQLQSESTSDYITKLRKLSSGCNFPNLERMLRDRLVCGMRDANLQYELLKRDNLRYEDVVTAMMSAENAGRDARMIQNDAARQRHGATVESMTAPDGDNLTAPFEPMDINAMQTSTSIRFCYRCGDRHSGECRFTRAVCRYCKKKGHIEKVCIAKKKDSKINFSVEETQGHMNGIYCFETPAGSVSAYRVRVTLDEIPVVMEIDTGASFSLINERTWQTVRDTRTRRSLKPSFLNLHTWTKSRLPILGQTTIRVRYKDVEHDLNVIVAKGAGPNLLGRNWFGPLNIGLNINFVSKNEMSMVEKIVNKHSDIFKEGLGTYRGEPVSIHLLPNAVPKFLKARPVPYAIKHKVEDEITRLEREGVLRSVPYSKWATPVVPIIKKSGEIRLCGDYRSTVNQATESDTYPMPTTSEVFATIAGGKYFTTLDLDRAYTQVIVDDATAKLLTLNTCKGLYTVHRLAFGVKACPGIFQRLMTSLLAGIPGVAILIDDIIVSGRSIQEMGLRLNNVLERIKRAGLRLNKKKCKFAKERVEFLGFVIDAQGIHPAPSKVEAIIKTPEPSNVQELQAFLGLYNFYERFIPHKATILEPLHRLLDKSRIWQWTKIEQNSFDTAKRLLSSDLTIVHYDLNKPLVLTCDSSDYGVGVVLSHMMEDGQERPVAMSSRTLHIHERRYSQLDKEAAAIMFGIKKFHNYLMGRPFTIVTDHKPLLGIFDPKKPMSNTLSPRLTRIAIALMSHNYRIIYKPGNQIGNADGLSRWPQPMAEEPEPYIGEILLMAEAPDDFPFDAKALAQATLTDKILSRVIHHVLSGWPAKVTDSELRAYWLHRLELSLHNDCILLGCRVVVPPKLRESVLQALHKTHSGIVQTKGLARSYVWWPNINNDIEALIQGCQACLENRHMPPKSTHKWITPTKPWSRINIDFAGPLQGKYFLIAVDAYSRWPEVFIVNNMTSATVIRHLRVMFATHGICEIIVSDNGTPFVSAEMKDFLAANKIRHITTAPYHPSTNGLAERMVQTVKDKLRKMNNQPWDVKLPCMLLGLRATPCSTTQKSPAELLMNRRLRTLLNTIHPDNIQHRKTEAQIDKNSRQKHRESNVGQDIMFRNFGRGPRWLPGTVINKEGPSSYRIETEKGEVVNRHIDQMIRIRETQNEDDVEDSMMEEVDEENVNETITEQRIEDNHESQDQDITEIPNPREWEEVLGIPKLPETDHASKTRLKYNKKIRRHSKSPYNRPGCSKDYYE